MSDGRRGSRSTVGAACSQAFNAALSVLVMKRRLPRGRVAALAVVALGTSMRSLDYLRADGERLTRNGAPASAAGALASPCAA